MCGVVVWIVQTDRPTPASPCLPLHAHRFVVQQLTRLGVMGLFAGTADLHAAQKARVVPLADANAAATNSSTKAAAGETKPTARVA